MVPVSVSCVNARHVHGRDAQQYSTTMCDADENLAVVLHGAGDVRVEPVSQPPPPGPGQVLLDMRCVGICGSDVSYVTKGRIGDFVVRAPMVLGHEASGVVAAVGADVTSLQPGDRVAVEPGVPCRRCDHCRSGRYNLCAHIYFCATPPDHGSLCRRYTHAADFCHRLPDGVTLEEGALVEPLAVGVHACRRAGIGAGQRVLVCGAGPIGLVCMLVARALGASSVAITDINPTRLQLAQRLGAECCLLVDTAATSAADAAVQMAARVRQELGEPDATIECSGVESSIATAIRATRSGGCVVLVGLGPDQVTLPIVNAATREVDVRGVFRYANCYPAAIALLQSGQLDVRPLVTHRYRLEQALQAIETARTGADGAVKVIINCNSDD